MKVPERLICRVLGQHRSTQRRRPRGRVDEERLVADMIELARQYGRYGYRRISVMLREAGWQVSDGRIERLWRREGLKVPQKQPKKGRLWLNDGSCIRLRPEYRDHVWSYDFVHHRTDDGNVFRTLNILDEYSRECLAIWVKRKLNLTDVIDILTICSSCGVFQLLSGLIMALSSLPRLSRTGSAQSAQRPPISRRDHRGRTDTARVLTPASGTNC
jgi:putative transposase